MIDACSLEGKEKPHRLTYIYTHYTHTHDAMTMMMMTIDSYSCQWLNRRANSFFSFLSSRDIAGFSPTFYASTRKPPKESRSFNDSIEKIWHWSAVKKYHRTALRLRLFFFFFVPVFPPSLSARISYTTARTQFPAVLFPVIASRVPYI